MNEISVMRSLRDSGDSCKGSKHLISVHEVYETHNSIYLVLDMISGGELLHFVEKSQSFSLDDTRLLMRNLLNAL